MADHAHGKPRKVQVATAFDQLAQVVVAACGIGTAVEPGVKVMDLKSDGVGLAMDDNNKPLITPEMMAAVEDATAKIVAGETKVHDYMTDNACPVR